MGQARKFDHRYAATPYGILSGIEKEDEQGGIISERGNSENEASSMDETFKSGDYEAYGSGFSEYSRVYTSEVSTQLIPL